MALDIKKITISNDQFFHSVEEFLEQGRSVKIKVKGFSMRPFLRNEKDNVSLERVSAEELERGDVVLFRHRGHHTLHRYYGTSEGQLLFKGDGNCVGCERVSADDVVARVSSVELAEGASFQRGSKEWRRRSRKSLTCKTLRIPIFYTKHIIKKIIRR